MLKMLEYMSTRPETLVPLIHCIIYYTLSLAMPDFCQMLLQFTDVMNFSSGANVSMCTSVPKEDILVHTIKFIWLILSTIRQNGDIVLDMLEFCYCWWSQGSVVTRCRCRSRGEFTAKSNGERIGKISQHLPKCTHTGEQFLLLV